MASSSRRVIQMRELNLNSEETGQNYTIHVPLDVYQKCSEDKSGMMANLMFQKIERSYTVKGIPKEKKLGCEDYKESVQILSEMNLLGGIIGIAKESHGVTIGTGATFDAISCSAYTKNLDDESIVALAQTGPPDLTARQRVRYTEVLAAAMPEEQNPGRTSPALSQDSQSESQSETQSICDKEDLGGESRTFWAEKATLLLIERRRELTHLFESSTVTQKQAWKKVAEELQKRGYNFTADECSKKFRGLKGRYKTIKEKNSQTGNRRHTWKFFDAMDEMFSADPAVLPITIASSMCLEPAQAADISQVHGEDTQEQPSTSTSTPRVQRKRRRFNSDLDEPPQWLEKYQQEQRRMHDERMALEERRVTALESLVSLLREKK